MRGCRCIAHIHTQGPYNGSASQLTTLSSLNEGYFPRSTAVMHTALYGASAVDPYHLSPEQRCRLALRHLCAAMAHASVVAAAARHGYSYRYVIAPWDPDSDRYATWAKVRLLPRSCMSSRGPPARVACSWPAQIRHRAKCSTHCSFHAWQGHAAQPARCLPQVSTLVKPLRCCSPDVLGCA